MFRRCASRPSTYKRPFPIYRAQPFRYNSTTAEPTRSTPRTPDTRKPNRWRRYISIIIRGVPIVTIGWLFLEPQRSSDSFHPYEVVAKKAISPTASVFYLEPENSSQEAEKYREIWEQGIWNVQFKQPQLQIVRAYTPLPPTSGERQETSSATTLRFLIRNDPQGEVSGYLHRLPIGSDIEVRGPNLEHYIAPNVTEVVFLAGGTGIAPALQVARAMFDEADDKPSQEKKLHILWANRKREDCIGGTSTGNHSTTPAQSWSWTTMFSRSTPPQPTSPSTAPQAQADQNPIVHDLKALQTRYPGRISVTYFVDEENSRIDATTLSDALSNFVQPPTSSPDTANTGSREIIISGPPGFIAYLAGPKIWQNGREEQGPLGGLLGAALPKQRGLGNVRVWKV